MKPIITYLIVLLTPLWVLAHDHGSHSIKYQANQGQWKSDLLFYGKTAAMNVYVGEGKFTVQIKDREDFDLLHEAHHGIVPWPNDFHIDLHNIEFELVDAKPSRTEGSEPFEDYVNYFIGNDKSRWAGNVTQYGNVTMYNAYEGIDFRLTSIGDHMKYEFDLAPSANAGDIQFKIKGADALRLDNGQLIIDNSIDVMIDQKPIAWQIIEGERVFINCDYVLQGDTLSFALKNVQPGYKTVIDPTLIFSTFTGSNPTDNWGSTATYDSLGNMYTGGIAITSLGGSMNGYPTTTGAFQTTFQGGPGTGTGYGCDIVISKFNSQGTSLLYSTYLGGNSNEIPHSLVVNSFNQLYVLATTSSSNFPTTTIAYDTSFNSGTAIGTGTGGNSNSVQYPNGSDIVITKFNTGGTGLVGSTFIGGSGNDGINLSDTLQKAYADEYRGEIIVDGNDNCYVATSTGSSNFPITNGFQSSFGGGNTDGVVFKFNANLSNLIWSTFIGGEDPDAAYSVQFDPSLNVFVTGGTKSTDFPTTTGVINPNYKGGTTDGWVAKISNNGQSLLASTFLGTTGYDQSFFVQLDLAGNVYCVGQSLGSYPITPSWVYSVNNSGQFLHKLTNNLQSTVFSTRWGSGNSNINLSLSAFLVNECNHIFVAGWGGTLFGTGASTSGPSTTNGLPTTSNAYQTTTDGSDMYFIVFEDSATGVLFASYFGGSGTGGLEHVDGGTSRFDKQGIIYQAVCAGCGGSNAFPTTSGSYSTTNGSNNCNLGAIKYDLITLTAEADVDGPTEVCVKDSLQFENESFGGSLYLWDFGDGESSDEFEPKHAYNSAGVYDVVLVIYDSVSCVFSDTDSIQVTVIPGPEGLVPTYPPVCPGTPIQLNASGGTDYYWGPVGGLSDPNIANPVATINSSTTYYVTIADSCGTDTVPVPLVVHPNHTDAINDTAICKGLSGTLWASGGSIYQWSPAFFLSNPNQDTTQINADTTTHYTVHITDTFGCERSHDVTVFVEGFFPIVDAWGDTSICKGERIELRADGTSGYEWFPKEPIVDPFINYAIAYPTETTTFVVISTNSCGSAADSVLVTVSHDDVAVSPDTAVCNGDTVHLRANGTLTYEWSGPEFETPVRNQNPDIVPAESGWYVVTGRNLAQCEDMDSLFVEVFDYPTLDLYTNEDTLTGLDPVRLIAQSSGSHIWSSDGFVPCTSCDTMVVYPTSKTTYYVNVYDSNGCHVSDSIQVNPISKIYVPNSFTPDGDGINDWFYVKGHNILDFEIRIVNRWGNEVYRSSDMKSGWNGAKHNKGDQVEIGTYTYTITYTVLPNQEFVKIGAINVIR